MLSRHTHKMHNEHVQSQNENCERQILDNDRHNTRLNNLLVDLASNYVVAAVTQAQQFVLMQLLLHTQQLSILLYFLLHQLPYDDSSTSAAKHAKGACNLLQNKIPIVTHIIAYQEQYYCPIPTNIIA